MKVLGFGGLGFGVWDSRLRVFGFGIWSLGLGFGLWGLKFTAVEEGRGSARHAALRGPEGGGTRRVPAPRFGGEVCVPEGRALLEGVKCFLMSELPL